jgi:type I restriction-modification system DNA methylase subunit
MNLTKLKLKKIIKEELRTVLKEGPFDNWAKSRRQAKTLGSWRDAADEEESLSLLFESLSDVRDGYYQYAYTDLGTNSEKKQSAAEVVKLIEEALSAARRLTP